jgi:hypothetical protein
MHIHTFRVIMSYELLLISLIFFYFTNHKLFTLQQH